MSDSLDKIKKQLGGTSIDARRRATLGLKGKASGVYANESVSLLLEALKDPSWRVRKSSLEVLIEEYPLEMYIDGLVRLLSLEDNAGARSSAIEALVRLGKRVTSHLIDMFETPDPDVRKFVIDTIGQIADKRALPVLLTALGDEDDNVRSSAVEYLGTLEDHSAVDPLIDILNGDNPWTAYLAADALGKLGDKRAVKALIGSLEREPLRKPVVRALGMIAGSSALKHIVPFIADRSRAVRNEALIALQRLHHGGVDEGEIAGALREGMDERIFDALLQCVSTGSREVRAPAILCLGMLRDERAINTLLDISLEEDYREDVKKALVFICREKPDILIPLLETENVPLLSFLCEVSGEVASVAYAGSLEGLLENDDEHVRSAAVLALGRIGEPAAVDSVKKLLTDPYGDVQAAAVNALTSLKEGLDEKELIVHLKNENPVLRKNIVTVLGNIGSRQSVPAVAFAMKDPDVSVRRAAVSALSSQDTEEALEHIIASLTDEDPYIRAVSVHKLGKTGRGDFLGHVSLLLSDSDDIVKVAAAKSLGIMGKTEAVQSLVELLSSDSGFVVAAVLDSLGKLGGDEARDALVDALSAEDTEIRRTAIRALSGFQDVDNLLLPFLRDGDWATRVATAESFKGNVSKKIRREMEIVLEEEDDAVVRRALEEALHGD